LYFCFDFGIIVLTDGRKDMNLEDMIYLCRTIGNMAGIPIRIYKEKAQVFYYSRVALPYDPITPELDNILSIRQHVGYYITEDFYYYGFVTSEDYTLILGPARHMSMSDQELKKMAFDLYVDTNDIDTFVLGMKAIIKMPLDSILQIMCTINFELNHEKLVPADITVFDKDQLVLYQEISDEELLFENYIPSSEPEQEDIIATYQIEQDIVNMVRCGDMDALHNWVKNAPVAKPAYTSPDSLRQQKNVIIITATLVSRAAIRGGMAVDDAIRLSDFYLQKSEKLNNMEQLNNLLYHMVENFTREVELLRYYSDQSELAIGVKQYVRHHMSETIKTEDIAESLFISRSRLSVKFHEETGQTLNAYIQMMKIAEAKHLLSYSDKNLLTISVYLGFSSQSYFCRVFKKETGISPMEYRKKYR